MADQAEQHAESVAAVDAMDACVWALRLELPSSVHADVQERWERVRALLNDGPGCGPAGAMDPTGPPREA